MRISVLEMPVSLSAAGLHPAAVVGVVLPVLVPPVVVVPPPVVVAPRLTVPPEVGTPTAVVTVPPRGATWPATVVVVSPVAPAWRLVFFLLSLPDRAATTPTPMSAIVRLSARPLAASLFAAIQPTHPRCATMRNL